MKPGDLALKANKIVGENKPEDYGPTDENFNYIAKLWSDWMNFEFTAKDIAILMMLLKVARLMTGKLKEDTLIDIAGYASIAGYFNNKD